MYTGCLLRNWDCGAATTGCKIRSGLSYDPRIHSKTWSVKLWSLSHVWRGSRPWGNLDRMRNNRFRLNFENSMSTDQQWVLATSLGSQVVPEVCRSTRTESALACAVSVRHVHCKRTVLHSTWYSSANISTYIVSAGHNGQLDKNIIIIGYRQY